MLSRAFLLFAVLLAGRPTLAADAQVDLPTIEEPGGWVVPVEFTVRARVAAITPEEPVTIDWRQGGEGLGGKVTHGQMGKELAVGAWSPAVPVASFAGGQFPGRLFVTFTAGRGGKLIRGAPGWQMEGASRDVIFEFEFSYKGKVVKTLRESAPDGGTCGLFIPAYRLAGGKTPDDPAFLGELTGLLEYARRRAAMMEKLPWASWPLPRKYAFTTDLGGYGSGIYYGIRYTDPAIIDAECRSLRQLGVNGLASAPALLLDKVYARTGAAKEFARMLYVQPGGYPVAGSREPDAGCPFAPGVAARTQENIAALRELLKLPVDEVWGRTVDEIGAVVDGTPEGKAHLAVCPRCAEGFREWLKGKGLAPADFGKGDWAQVSPLNIWPKKGDPLPDLSDPHTALLAYYSSSFLNYSSAKLFTAERDAMAQVNAEKRRALAAGEKDTPAAKQPFLYTFALRGNTFLMGGHSLDFFDYYRLADNAFVYETSNRDARIWGWDSYLCDVGRVVSQAQKLQLGIYVKPHRGAPVQRALSAAARGASMIYWYTYGPDYVKGDSFSPNPEALEQASKAAHLLGKVEDVLYGAAWARPAEVAVVKPRSSEIWMRLSPDGAAWPAAWENAKWIYTALAHAHLPVDPLDEGMLAHSNLSRYKVIYVNGPNLTRAAAAKLAAWVQAGGTLYTSGWGLARDEANQPLEALRPALGLQARGQPEMWRTVGLYGGGSLGEFEAGKGSAVPGAAPADRVRITSGAPFDAAFDPVVGREVLQPAAGTDVLARFADGGAALTRHAYGKGQTYVAGFFPGLEYSARVRSDRFDMARDFDAGIRRFVAAPALAAVQPVVDTSQPAVEGVLLRNPASGKRAVALMNWAYRVSALRKSGARTSPVITLVPFEGLKVTLRGAGPVRSVRSAMLGKALPVAPAGDAVTITLPRLEEGDVLLLE